MLKIIPLTSEYNKEATKVIASGLAEYFDRYEPKYNPDLYHLFDHYNKRKSIFLIGLVNHTVVATGGLIEEKAKTARIVRMSVKKEYRKQGNASKILKALEKYALKKGYTRIILETTKSWHAAITFYKSNGYEILSVDDLDVHFKKNLESNRIPS